MIEPGPKGVPTMIINEAPNIRNIRTLHSIRAARP